MAGEQKQPALFADAALFPPILPSILTPLLHRPRLSAFIAGAASATGFAPLSLWPICLIAITLLMALTQQAQNRKQAFSVGWFFGLGHFTVMLNWIAHAFTYQEAMPHWFGYGSVVLLSLYLAIWPGVTALATHAVRMRFPAAPITPLFAGLWVLTEMARGWLFTGFAWNPLGLIWLGTGVDQTATWVGSYGLSALVVLMAGGLLALLRKDWKGGAPVLAAGVILAAAGLFTTARAPMPTPSRSTPAITVVQPNVGQVEKYDATMEMDNFAKLVRLTGSSSPDRPRLIFWPEAAIEAWLDMEPEWRERLAHLLGPNDLLMTGGVKVYIDEKAIPYGTKLTGAHNSVWVVTPDARLIRRYDKAHLVPYGEYLPMREILEPIGLSRLVPGAVDFIPGPGPQSLLLPAGKGWDALSMGVQICYEIIFSGKVIDRTNRPGFIYNPSNDAWFGAWGPPQHLAQARMRAIEEGMPIIRSTPTGISAVIDGHGRVIASIPHHQEGAINSALPAALPATLYARLGISISLALAIFLVVLAVATARRRG
ncbi:MAG: apolipoprotein N-acyltransferase [Sphingobium sp.]|nr:apolipoprotein N-acyltransferase [Sphingobium sp.]